MNLVAIAVIMHCLLQHFSTVTSYVPRRMRRAIAPSPKEIDTSNRSIWIDRFGEQHKNPQPAPSDIKVVTYNVLGPIHGESSKHHYAPVSITKWTRRRDRLMDELRAFSADVYCLQEVSEKGLAETFIPGLLRIGLHCFGFAPMKDRSSGGHRNIGCAIFCNPSKLTVMFSKRVHLKDFAPLSKCRSHEFYVDVKSKSNTMVMTLVKIIATNQTLVIANTHLFWNPEREDIKTAQACSVGLALTHFCESCGYSKDDLPPLILCGDFNGTPSRAMNDFGSQRSALFELLMNGALPTDHPDHPDKFHVLVRDRPVCPRLGDLRIDWMLQNIFDGLQFKRYAPLFTTKTDDYQGWIDHIWVNNKVDVDMVLMPPVCVGDLEANLKSREFNPMPSESYASDHIPLGFVAKLKPITASEALVTATATLQS